MTKPAHSSKYDGLYVYAPLVSALRPGDILLTRNAEGGDLKGKALSKTILAASGGSFDHALICTAPPTFVEAVDIGVCTLSLQRCFTHSMQTVRVLRYADPAAAAHAAQRAQLQVGRTYSKRKAAASVFPEAMVDEIKHKGIFCSALVAQAFTDAGAPEFAATNVSKTTPATLEKMACLIDVTDQVFRKILSPPNIESMSALDGARAETPSIRQTFITMAYAATLVPSADAILEAFPEAELESAHTFYDAMQFIVRAMDARGKIPEPRRADFDAQVAILDDMAALCVSSGELMAVQDELAQHETVEMQRDLAESFKLKPDIDLVATRAVAHTTIAQIAERQTAIDNLTAWSAGRSKAMAAWAEVQAPTIAFQKARLATCREIVGRLDPGGAPIP